MLDTAETIDTTKKIQELAAENDKLRQAVDQLSMLNDLSLSISGTIDSQEIMDTIIDRSICFIGAQRGNITVIDENQHDRGKMLARNTCSPNEHAPIRPQKTILKRIKINREPVRLNDLHNNSELQTNQWDPSIHSILSVPLMVHSRLTGVLTIYNKKDGPGFTDQDQQLLSIIASQSAQVIENARLKEKEQQLNKVEKDIEVANKIQQKLLPKEAPNLQGYNLYGKNITAQSIGGDYYDFIQLDDYRWVICLGDVSGKGLPASLLMSNLQALIRGELPCHHSPGRLLKSVNKKLYENTDADKFATVFLGILDTRSQSLTYSNAGHEYPFVIHSDKSYNRLKTGGMPIGVMGNQTFEEKSIELHAGDKLIAYSDGITDSRDNKNREFGENRLEKLLLNKTDSTASVLINSIFDASIGHSKQSELFDDMSAVVLSKIT
jgi:sigma-B regulation protein RsbU (phosphoserine phosphatase)